MSARLKAIHVENYRSFKEPFRLELRPLTLVYGWNNAGKSAAVRLVKLLGDSLGDKARAPLDSSVAPTYRDLVWRPAVNRPGPLKFGLEWDSGNPKRATWRLDYDRDASRMYVRELEIADPKGYAAAHGADLGAAAKPLQHWLWATTYTEYFTGMTAGQLRRAFDHVRNICNGSEPLPTDMPTTCSPLKRFRWPSVRALAFMHLLAQQFPKDKGKRVGSSEARLLARGGETSNLLYPDRPASDPANRFLVAPKRAAALRRALFKASHKADPLREHHVLPPRKDPASGSVEKTLEWRRTQLRRMEVDFILSLGLKVREAD
jgi:hypothetical protein